MENTNIQGTCYVSNSINTITLFFTLFFIFQEMIKLILLKKMVWTRNANITF